MKLPEEVRPIWRTIIMYQISRGIDTGLRIFIIGPCLYGIFKDIAGESEALFYTSLIWAIYSGLVALLELPTGALADILGRVRAIIGSSFGNFFYGLGLACLICFKSVPAVLIIAVIAFTFKSVSYSLHNGAFTAWVVDSIREKRPEIGYERLLARGDTYYYWAKIVGGVLGVIIFLQGITVLAFLTGALVCLCCTAYCMAEMEETQTLHFSDFGSFWNTATGRISSTIISARKICSARPVLWWLILAFATYDFVLGVIQYMWPVYMSTTFGASRWSPKWLSIVFAVPCVAALSAHFLAWFADRHHRVKNKKMSNRALRQFVTIVPLTMVSLPLILLSVMHQQHAIQFAWFYIVILLIESSAGIVETCFSTLVNNFLRGTDSQQRATVLSFGSMLSSVMLLVLLIPSSGVMSGSITSGWILPAVLLAIVVLISNFMLKRNEGSSPVGPLTVDNIKEASS